MKIVLATGGFDPLHSGHISYFDEARKLGDMLVVGLNTDDWLIRNKGRVLMPWDERASVISALEFVQCVIGFEDSDDTAGNAIFQTLAGFPGEKVIFANGGDIDNTPEYEMYGINDDVEFVYGIGGNRLTEENIERYDHE